LLKKENDNGVADIKHQLTLVKPETILSWQRTLLKRFWTFEHRPAQRGRKPVDAEVKNLILSMKNDNLLWGVKRIQGELLKLDISLSTKTIRKILQCFWAEMEDPEFPDLEAVSGNADEVHLCDGFPHGRHHAGQTVLRFRNHLAQNAGDYSVCHD
jgi:hypothetical protein